MALEEEFTLQAIGHYFAREKYSYEAPRQGSLAPKSEGLVKLLPDRNYQQALQELAGFERIWLLYLFHQNKNWKPMIRPPRRRKSKVGVFASRAPHRPNPIGLSAVELLEVRGLELRVRGSDILNETPILDIKPYLPYADSFPESKAGWADFQDELHQVQPGPIFLSKAQFVQEHTGLDAVAFAALQLEHEPTNDLRKRVQPQGPEFILAYRTWRIRFRVEEKNREVFLEDIFSGYSPSELADAKDPYNDKTAHRDFNKQFE